MRMCRKCLLLALGFPVSKEPRLVWSVHSFGCHPVLAFWAGSFDSLRRCWNRFGQTVSLLESWKPVDTEGKKQYDREFLLDFQYMPPCIQKPEGLPPISDVVLDKVSRMRRKKPGGLSARATGAVWAALREMLDHKHPSTTRNAWELGVSKLLSYLVYWKACLGPFFSTVFLLLFLLNFVCMSGSLACMLPVSNEVRRVCQRFPGTGVEDTCEPHCVGAGNWTLFCCWNKCP